MRRGLEGEGAEGWVSVVGGGKEEGLGLIGMALVVGGELEVC